IDQLTGTQALWRFDLTPKRQGSDSTCGVEAVGFHGSCQKCGIGGHVESRLTRDSVFRPDLRLPNTQQVFFFFLVGFDFPTIEIGLQSFADVSGGIANQQIGLLAIQKVTVGAILERFDYNQAQRVGPSSALPQHALHGFVAKIMLLSRGKNLTALPRHRFILSKLLGSRKRFAIPILPPFALFGLLGGLSIQSDILSRSTDEDGARGKSPENRAIAEAGIYDSPENLLHQDHALIETSAQIFQQADALSGES